MTNADAPSPDENPVEPMPPPADRSPFLSEGFILAVLSAYAYTIAYLYERGYAEAFGIPPDLIDLRWPTFFGAAVSVVSAAGIVGGIFTISASLQRRHPKLERPLSIFVIPSVWLLTAAFVLGVSRWRILLGFFVLSIVLFSIVEITSRPLKRALDARFKSPGPLMRALFRQPDWAILASILMLLSWPVALFAGFVDAVNKDYFLVTSSSPPSTFFCAICDSS